MTAGKPARVFPPCAISQAPALFSPGVTFQDCANNQGSLNAFPRDSYFWFPCFSCSLEPALLMSVWFFPPASVRLAALEAAG